MLRTRQPNGFVTPQHLDAIAEAADKKGKGFADITTRQDFQLHWIHHAQALGILQQFEAAGISTAGSLGDAARNVVGCPVAGVDRDELFDASPTAEALNAFFLNNAAFTRLPRKLKISVSACRSRCCHPEIQCMALVGRVRMAEAKAEPGFDLCVGGGLSSQPFVSQRLNVFIKPDEAVAVVGQLVDIWCSAPEYRQSRDHARLKFLVNEWGVDKLRAALEERLGRTFDAPPADGQELPDSFRDHVGVHAQKKPGWYYIGAPVLAGRITSQQMRKAADLCRRYGDGKSIRLTVRQNLLLLNVPEAAVEKVLNGFSDVGLSVNAHPLRRGLVACVGSEFCRLAVVETKARARQIVEYLEQRVSLDEPLRLHIDGCISGCAQSSVAHIGLLGAKTEVDGQVVDSYDVFLGGQLGAQTRFGRKVLAQVPANACARHLEKLLLGYKRRRKPNEAFNDWCAHMTDEALALLLTEEASHPLAEAEVA